MAEATRGAREGSFGFPVSDEIIKQVQVRGNVFAKENKTPQDLMLIHVNAPWIMLRSGVDTPVLVGGENKTSSEDAKKCILVGGSAVLANDGSLSLRQGIVGQQNPAYNLSSVMGYRPIPGITSINVKTKDVWGAIMEAEINIQVWSREDLALIDKLFFKPGMTALLEWGHSVWVDNSGKIQKTTLDTVLASSTFFEKGHTFTEIDNLVQKNRERFNGNYEACFGYITNFSYSFNDKGGYDCTVKMLSKGSVLEGLKIAKTSEKSPDGTTYNSEYHRLFQPLIEMGYSRGESGLGLADEAGARTRKYIHCWELPDTVWNEGLWKDKQIFKNQKVTLFLFSLRAVDLNLWTRRWRPDKAYTYNVYLSLRDLLKIIQVVNNNFYVGEENSNRIRFDLFSENQYTTFEGHFSLNPYIACVPHRPSMDFNLEFDKSSDENQREKKRKSKTITPKDIEDLCVMFDDSGSKVTFPAKLQDVDDPNTVAGFSKILNIPVSANYFLGLIDSIIESEPENFNIFRVITELLEGIQKAFGNINSFGLHYNHVDDLWSIVDRNNPKLWKGNEGPGRICVSGLNTTVNHLGVNSAVSPSIANEMTIAAQAPATGSSDASPSLVNWNEGCQCRHSLPPELTAEVWKRMTQKEKEEEAKKQGKTVEDLNKQFEGIKKETVEKEKYWSALQIYYQSSPLRNFYTRAIEFYKIFNSYETAGTKDVNNYAETKYSELQLHGESIFARCINQEAKTGETAGSLCMGIIPVKVELDLLGVSRFVVGTSFRITPGILLPKYDSWGYIVTGVENKVDASGWKTHLTTQYFPIIEQKQKQKRRGPDTPSWRSPEIVPSTYEPEDGYAEEATVAEVGTITREHPLICLTPAHGTAGTKKAEHAWSQKLITSYIVPALQAKGYTDNILLCDLNQLGSKNSGGYSLREANKAVATYGSNKVISVVPHWNGGSGNYWYACNVLWGFPPLGSETLMNMFYKEADSKFSAFPALGVKVPEKTGNLRIDAGREDTMDPACMINCTRILTENLFADNRVQGPWIKSPEGMQVIGQLHADAIDNYIKTLA